MMSILLSQIATAPSRLVILSISRLADQVARLAAEWRYRSDIHKLHAMSDRQLSDIGLSRSRIEEAVRGGAPREVIQGGHLKSVYHP